jgi:hypothetical protein
LTRGYLFNETQIDLSTLEDSLDIGFARDFESGSNVTVQVDSIFMVTYQNETGQLDVSRPDLLEYAIMMGIDVFKVELLLIDSDQFWPMNTTYFFEMFVPECVLQNNCNQTVGFSFNATEEKQSFEQEALRNQTRTAAGDPDEELQGF